MDPQATCGRIVHYMVAKGIQRSGIVMRDTPPDGTAAITVFLDAGPSPIFGVPYSDVPGVVGSWNWMPYQKAKAATARGNVSESAVGGPPPAGEPGFGAPPAGSVGPGEGVQSDPVAGSPAVLGDDGEETAAAPGDEKPVVDSEAPKVSDAADAPEVETSAGEPVKKRGKKSKE